jgi:hypothetical protein
MTIVKVEELEKGDEILIPSVSKFKYLRVLTEPKVSTKKHWGDPNKVLYKSVKCSTAEETYKMVYGSNTYACKRWALRAEDHNRIIYQNLNDNDILLIKKTSI